MEHTNQSSPATPHGNSITSGKSKSVLITVVIGLVLLTAIWIWKSIEISSLRKQAESDRQNLVVQANKKIVQNNEEHLKLLAKPLVWAFRSDLIQGNLNQINLYLSDLIKEQHVQRITVADATGKIIASTNKKDEGQPFQKVYGDAGIPVNDAEVQNIKDSTLVLTSPIMGFNSRIGTLMIRYEIPPSGLSNIASL